MLALSRALNYFIKKERRDDKIEKDKDKVKVTSEQTFKYFSPFTVVSFVTSQHIKLTIGQSQ